MKGRRKDRREHVVPLSARCLQIAQEARTLNPDSELLFPGPYTGVQLSDMTLTKVLRDLKLADRATAHGFRSSFRDWATEVTRRARWWPRQRWRTACATRLRQPIVGRRISMSAGSS